MPLPGEYDIRGLINTSGMRASGIAKLLPVIICLLAVPFKEGTGTENMSRFAGAAGHLEFYGQSGSFSHCGCADSIYASLSPAQRISSLFWVTIPGSGRTSDYYEYAEIIRSFSPGGIIVSPDGQESGSVAEHIRFFQGMSAVPLFVAVRGSAGGGVNLSDHPVYPGSVSLGAVTVDSLFYSLGHEMARQYRQLGLHINILSVSDEDDVLLNDLPPGTKQDEWMRGLSDGGIYTLKEVNQQDDSLCRLTDNKPLSVPSGEQTFNDEELQSFAGWFTESGFVLHSSDPGLSVAMVKESVRRGLLNQDTVESKIRSFLEFKCRLGLICSSAEPSGPETTPGNGGYLLSRQLFEASLLLLKNDDGILPLRDIDRGSFALVMAGEVEDFAGGVADYLEMPVFRLDRGSSFALPEQLKQIGNYDRIIAGIGEDFFDPVYDQEEIIHELFNLLASKETVIVWFGSPGSLSLFPSFENAGALLIATENNSILQNLASQAVFGAVKVSGRLPDSESDILPFGAGLDLTGGFRLKYTIPEEAGLDSRIIFPTIDSIVNHALGMKAFPGCRILVALDGMVIADMAYGYHTYSGRVEVKKNDIYDIASVTKILGPLPLYMKLFDEGKLDLDLPLSHYWSDWENRFFRRSNKETLVLRDLLTHQSGIVPYISYWQNTLKNGRYIRRWYRHEPFDNFSVEIASHLYLRDNFRRRVYREIRRSALLTHGEYRYSCLPFIVSPEVIAAIDERPYTESLYNDFFSPLGASTLRYNPVDHFPLHRIVPTEKDSNYRRGLVHGYVHDEAAAVLGGVSGNAGLFSSAGDIAKVLQMYLNGGVYGGRRYLSNEVIEEFARIQYPGNNNRRGIGFDKPLPDNHERPAERRYPCTGASAASFGHSGFTGTFVWADPGYDLLYVFLSNRVHPDRSNNLISTLNVRTEILQVFYDAINTSLTK